MPSGISSCIRTNILEHIGDISQIPKGLHFTIKIFQIVNFPLPCCLLLVIGTLVNASTDIREVEKYLPIKKIFE